MAGAMPTADQLSQVCGITQVDEASARILLRVRDINTARAQKTQANTRSVPQKHNNDPNSAINAFFEDPVASLREAVSRT